MLSDLKEIQRRVGVADDGLWGPATARAINAALDVARGGTATLVGNGFDPVESLDVTVLRAAAPGKSVAELAPWVNPIKAACRKYQIDSIRRVAAFLTTLAHEGKFKVGARENMNYSAERLAEVWPSRFRGPNGLAIRIARNPEAIANEVYADRMGNGPPSSGDGWKYRGNGPIQLTGKSNHMAFAKAMGMSLPDATAWISTMEGGIMSAAWFWDANLINVLADTPGVSDETKRINGGLIGLADRTERFNRTVARLLAMEAGA